MQPSKERIDEFLALAPAAGEGLAFAFLEGSNTVEEAVNAYFDNPNKYSSAAENGDKSKTSAGSNVKEAPPTYHVSEDSTIHDHTNAVIEAANLREKDEQEMQNLLQNLQYQYEIYNSDLEPEHDIDGMCNCPVHQYKTIKFQRLPVQNKWSKAVMYPGEKAYSNCYMTSMNVFTNNPYRFNIASPYNKSGGVMTNQSKWRTPRIYSHAYTASVIQTIELNKKLNLEAQASVDGHEPKSSIWEVDQVTQATAALSLDSKGTDSGEAAPSGKRQSWLKKMVSRKTPEEKEADRQHKINTSNGKLRNAILKEEHGRWPTQEWRRLVADYQAKVGMTAKIAELRARCPIQYLHLLSAGYFEPIPVAWADQDSNPLKFTIEGAAGWRGITPAWRGFEDTAEERLYWVLNHREGSEGPRLKPDMVSALGMAIDRMLSAVEPPPQYFSAGDTCHVQHTSEGYSKQVMPPPFHAFDAPETALDDTMILLDVSSSMDFEPIRPVYADLLIMEWLKTRQPKNKDVAKAIIRRFVDAMINHSHSGRGYELTTFSSHASYLGVVNHANFESMWRNVRFGGTTRVMTGWQRVKRLHFEKHRESATHHPVYGWQAGPQTPMLRLLLLLDGEASDMDEFELDLLGNSWAHVTIFLIGVDGCPHHHRHANELQRISEVNHHVSFVDAQGNMPERLVTHELLKRHLGYEVSMDEFEQLEQPPPAYDG